MKKEKYIIHANITSKEKEKSLTLDIDINDNIHKVLSEVNVETSENELRGMNFSNVDADIERNKIKDWAYALFENSEYDYGRMVFSKDLFDNKKMSVQFKSLSSCENCIESLKGALNELVSAWYKIKNMKVTIELVVEE